jgi:Predicted hydrolase (HAD superfamily)
MIPYLVDLEVVFNFGEVKEMEELRSLTLSLNNSRQFKPLKALADMISPELYARLLKVKPFEDSLFLEELSYRTRVYVITNLPKVDAKSLLLRSNLDVFVQDVISAEEVGKFLPAREILEFGVRRANSVVGATTFLTASLPYALPSRELGMRVVLLRRNYRVPESLGIIQVPSLGRLAEITAQQRVDGTMGDSALRCT